jgi:1,4-alpha-glucan branching enzyme
MWAHPGKKLLFMGAELAPQAEWDHDRSLDWHLLDQPANRGVHDLLAELNRVAADHPALWALDTRPAGFGWIDADDADHSVFAFVRRAGDGWSDLVVCVANLTPVPRHGYRVGLPSGGRWEDVVNTDDVRWGGSGLLQPSVDAEDTPWQGQAHSAVLTLPPLAVRWLVPSPD